MLLARISDHLQRASEIAAESPAAGAATSTTAPAASTSSELVEAAARRLAAAMKLHAETARIPAISVGIVKRGVLLHQACHGSRRLEGGGRRSWAVEADSVFQVASISKTVTGVCAMQCVERGLLALDDDVSALTAEHGGFPVRNPKHPDQKITLRMLMSHASSVDDSSVYQASYTAGDSQWSLADFCREYFSPEGCFYSAGCYTDELPGAGFRYSNVGAGLVGYLVEAASGMSFPDFAEANVFAPLGMASSSFLWSGLRAKGVDLRRVAMPYSWVSTAGEEAAGGYHKREWVLA
jgi:CubicO group peptidase (beta-lactamase class C family)